MTRRLGLLALLTLSLLAALPLHAGKKPPQILLRVHIQTTGEGLPDSQAVTIALPPNGELIQIRALAEATERDLIGVDVEPNGYLRLRFDHRAQVNISAATGQNIDRIMVVLLNGQVIYAPVIDEQITSGSLVIPVALPPQIVQDLKQLAQDNAREQART